MKTGNLKQVMCCHKLDLKIGYEDGIVNRDNGASTGRTNLSTGVGGV